MMRKLFSKLALIAMVTLLASNLALAQDSEDTTEPSDVENIAAVAGDEQITLTWDAATDDTGVVGYKIYHGLESVTEDGGEYNLAIIPVESVEEHVVDSLENGTPYYFAITAVDAAGNESINYSYEVSATPTAEAVDGDDADADEVSPTVTSATALTDISVSVVFSEAVVIPEESPEAVFSIEHAVSGELLTIVAAEMDLEDVDEKTVILTTAAQEEDAEYILTVGADVTDEAGNPLVSGVSDTAIFTGLAAVEEEEEEEEEDEVPTDTEPPSVVTAASTDLTIVEVEFSEEVVLAGEVDEMFSVVRSVEEAVSLEVISAALQVDDATVVELITAEQVAGTEYKVVVAGVTDVAGNEILEDDVENVATFTYEEGVIVVTDTTAPEDVTVFAGVLDGSMATLSWMASLDSTGDLADQTLYISTDGGVIYSVGTALGSAVVSYETPVVEGNTYTYKLTVKDVTGNESTGVTTAVEVPVKLTETGPAHVALLMLAAMAVSGMYFRYAPKRS